MQMEAEVLCMTFSSWMQFTAALYSGLTTMQTVVLRSDFSGLHLI